jgi:quercetin dioxygenase-like cupin family protein
MGNFASRMTLAAVLCTCATPALTQNSPNSQAGAARPVPTTVWAAKPVATPSYTPPQQPWIKLAELKAQHKNDVRWHELLVDDGRLTAQYFFDTPGTIVGRRLHPDTREWFAVVEGEVRVDIEGQPLFTATRGSLVNIPRQTIYSLETVGDRPSLRFVVNVARAQTLFPQDVEPPSAPAGTAWMPVTINRTPGRYDEFNQPHLNIHEAAAKDEKYSGGRFVRDDTGGGRPGLAAGSWRAERRTCSAAEPREPRGLVLRPSRSHPDLLQQLLYRGVELCVAARVRLAHLSLDRNIHLARRLFHDLAAAVVYSRTR